MKNIAIASIVLMMMSACDYAMMVETPDFAVDCHELEVCVGDTVRFDFSGKADYITFYSGEPYADYAFREGRTIIPGALNTLSFESAITEVGQMNQVSIFLSNEFNGNYLDYTSLINSDWTDVTSEFALAGSDQVTESNTMDISSYIVEEKPLYIAFRYKTKTQTENGKASRWVFSNLKINTYPEGLDDCTMYEIINSGFRIVDPFSRTKAACRSSISQTQLVLQGNFYGKDSDGIMQGEDLENEHWVISRALDMKTAKNIGPDRPVSVKGYTQPMPKSYGHAYEKAGEYEAVFVVSCQSLEEKKETVHKVKIVVTENVEGEVPDEQE